MGIIREWRIIRDEVFIEHLRYFNNLFKFLQFKEFVNKFYEKMEKSYRMVEKGMELANFLAVNLLPNEEKEKGETSKIEIIEPRKNMEKGNIGKGKEKIGNLNF